FFQAEDGIRDFHVTGVQTCALPISGGDVFEIIEPLTKMSMPDLLAFTRMTGDLVKAMRHAPQPIVAAVDGICAGAGAMVALASEIGRASCREGGEIRVCGEGVHRTQ